MDDGMGRRDFVKVASLPVLFGGLSTSVPSVRASSHEWTSYGKDPQNTGFVDRAGPTQNISQGWQFRAESSIVAPACTGEGNIYVGSQNGTVYAVNGGRGTQRWEYGGVGEIRSAPAYYDGTVYINAGGSTYALNADEKGLEWQHSEGLGPASSPNIDETTEAVYLAKSRSVFALDANDGSVIWSFDIGRNSMSAPALDQDNNMLFVAGGEDGTVYGRDLIDGNGAWSVTTGSPITGGVTYKDGRVYATDTDGNVYAFDSGSGNQVWSKEIRNGGFDGVSPTVANGRVYVGAQFSNLYALNADNGEREWVVETPSSVNGSAAVAGDAVYFAEGSRIRAVRADNGESLWDFEANQNFHSPIVQGDTVYAGTETAENSLYAIKGDAVLVGASIEIMSAVLNSDTITRNDEYSVTVTLENSGGESGEIELELRRDGELDRLTETYSVGGGDTREVTLTSDTAGPMDEGEYSIDINGVSAGTLTVSEDQGGDNEDDSDAGSEDGDGGSQDGSDGNQDDGTDGTDGGDDEGGDTGGNGGSGDDTDTVSNGDGDDGGGNTTDSSGDDGGGGGGGDGLSIPAGVVAGAAGVIGIAGGVAAAYLYSERQSGKGDADGDEE